VNPEIFKNGELGDLVRSLNQFVFTSFFWLERPKPGYATVIDGSISAAHAFIPPFTLYTFSKPSWAKNAHALALREPERHMMAYSVS
jgi:hypothetical protein